MDNQDRDRERRRQQRLERLGTNHPICVTCGESAWQCLTDHHVAGRKYDDTAVLECLNCHAKLTDAQKDHPKQASDPPHRLECIGRFLLGLADLFSLLVERLKEFGNYLIDLAREAKSLPVGDQA